MIKRPGNESGGLVAVDTITVGRHVVRAFSWGGIAVVT